MTTICQDPRAIFVDGGSGHSHSPSLILPSSSPLSTSPASPSSTSSMSSPFSFSASPPPMFSAMEQPKRRISYIADRPLVYVTRRIPQKGMDILLDACDVKQWDSEEAVPHGELLRSVEGVEGIFCMPGDIVDKGVLDAAGPELRVIATTDSRTDYIDINECEQRAIQVLTCPDQPTEILAELTIALVLLTLKESQTEEERLQNFEPKTPDLITDSQDQLPNSWPYARPRLMKRMSEERMAFEWNNGKPRNTKCLTWKNIVKKSFGIYGMTKLGIGVARLLRTIGVADVMMADKDIELADQAGRDESGKGSGERSKNTVVSKADNGIIEPLPPSLAEAFTSSSSPTRKHIKFNVPDTIPESSQKPPIDGCRVVPFEELLESSDIICICGSNGELSLNVFNRESFLKMKKDAVLVTSQSDENALDYVELYCALRDGHIKAAGLNDCNQKTTPFKTLLLGVKNCVFLPQTQESVYDMRHKISVLISKNLTEVLKATKKNRTQTF